ncbi:GNAT family N-acetyltransferase [Photobacterium galatheae]|uniref:GCN5 family acetyltransferase n=1 Tax=Photobacterium galatheae TaxID=1654360 RepID=A0A066RMA7_9GAMM|nr:GNAT family N-acetyltransferase [Photobacterium galatheae]KDM90226.1 GCN5 family acetyltransferase [Photobacterium galatheae]MCM0151511.1 GNAT family N-acetyltransferase [Photobacterium galatheae]
MENKSLMIRPMHREEVDIAVEWAAQEGWNPGVNDAACYATADPTGFLIGFLGEEPIATISAIRYDDTFGFIGFYIVKPEYRGKGYGIQIWHAALKYLEGCNIGLDGVVEQQANYQKSGFQLAYSNLRYEGVGGSDVQADAAVVPLSDLSPEVIEAYERPFFPVQRPLFLQAWLNQPHSHALGIMKNDQLAGYGVIRRCQNGYKIGPLYADNTELAERLFLALKSRAASSQPVFLDVPEVNTAAVALAEKYGMTVSFGTARMYTQKAPELPLDRLFGVTSFEIG